MQNSGCKTVARHFMHYLRGCCAHGTRTPESLELLLFLYCNSDLWEYPAIIDEAMSWEKEQQEAEAAAAAAAAERSRGR